MGRGGGGGGDDGSDGGSNVEWDGDTKPIDTEDEDDISTIYWDTTQRSNCSARSA